MTDEVAEPGRSGELKPVAGLRASHEDRERVVDLLRVAAGDGRITVAELDERLEAALTARTQGELAVLTSDLPASPGVAPHMPAPKPKDVVHIACHSGSTEREGRWIVPQRLEAQVRSGRIRLDFTQAVITQPLLHIDADVSSGSLVLVTRPGIVVDTDDVAIRSGRVRVCAPWGHDVPVTLRIDVSGTVASGEIRARPPRRTFWQWLRRRPYRYALTSAG